MVSFLASLCFPTTSLHVVHESLAVCFAAMSPSSSPNLSSSQYPFQFAPTAVLLNLPTSATSTTNMAATAATSARNWQEKKLTWPSRVPLRMSCSAILCSFLVDQGDGSMGEWVSFFTVPLRGSEIVKGTMRRQATRRGIPEIFVRRKIGSADANCGRWVVGSVAALALSPRNGWPGPPPKWVKCGRQCKLQSAICGLPGTAVRCRHCKCTVSLPARQKLAAFN